MSTDWDGARQKAKEVREKYSLIKPPINAFDIAKSEGITIAYFKPDDNTKDISGLLEINQKKIYLNAYESAARQNFTLAHELAHYFLKHRPDQYGVYKRNSLYSTTKPEKEKEADAFAAELLMPAQLIKKVKRDYGLSDKDIITLSRLFGVSASAMEYRLKGLRDGQDRF
jgi:Zn-dependent peptidase ImmA (M78 family)